MTQAGKCNTCRQRKVKCDEEKPKCGACKKKDRVCTYTFGKISALDLEDPNQYSGHGKAKVAPCVVPLQSNDEFCKTENREDSNGGRFLTSETSSQIGDVLLPTHSRPCSQVLVSSIPQMPSSPDSLLAARYLQVIEAQYQGFNPISIDGFWIGHVPPRIGTSPVLDRAIEFMLDSFATHFDSSHTKRVAARMSKGKALKALREGLERDGIKDDVVIASMLHFTAEIYMGLNNVDWALHVLGANKMLTQGNVQGIDEDLLWSLVDGLYMDEVSQALLEGRPSAYDGAFYLNYTYAAVSEDPSSLSMSLFDQLSRAVMHVLVQIPRLSFYMRDALRQSDSSRHIEAAVFLAQQLWIFSPDTLAQRFIDASSTTLSLPPGPDIADLISDSFSFDTVQSLIVLTKYWRFRIFLCGLLQRLHLAFADTHPAILTSVPNLETVVEEDVNAAKHLAQCLQFALSFSSSLQLVPLRILSSLQVSIGTWIRLIRHLRRRAPDSDLEPSSELINAQRIKSWIIEASNRIHDVWHVPRSDEETFEMALDIATGDEIPEAIKKTMGWNQWDADEFEALKAYHAKSWSGSSIPNNGPDSTLGHPARNNHVAGELGDDMVNSGQDHAGNVT